MAFVRALFLAFVGARADDGKNWEAVVGDVRVQTISPVLFRVEPKGQWGFEDRNTFMVANRDFAGEPITEWKDTKISTKHYTIQLSDDSPGKPSFMVFNTKGDKIYDTAEDPNTSPQLLHWPPPYTASAYAIVDKPRFAVPDWGVAPLWDGAEVDENLKATNGYDFGNQVDGDTYVFLMGEGLDGWNAARTEYASLCGPVPLLPDFAFGAWWTWWHWYTEEEAKGEIEKWEEDKLPLDVWGLDMEWREIDSDKDHSYDHPNLTAFPGFSDGSWFDYLHWKKLRTFFNDHPFPAGSQTGGAEVGFRWNGLTSWLQKGLDFWWFDHNWKFGIPPPQVESTDKDSNWEGLTNTAWGSHVYYNIVKHFNKYNRDPMKDGAYMDRPIILSKFAPPDWEAGMDAWAHAERPGHHRYPVWWTGDKVTLQASVESMVDAGVYDLKPYVHSDCGGDGWVVKAGEVMRWVAHCAFGNIFRLHGSDHRPWIYGGWWENTIRSYLNMRYRLMPSIIAGGQRATETGFPIVARMDLYWPEYGEATRDNSQYIWLDDLLVAPIFYGEENMTSRSVYIPPGDWQSVWDGSIVTGPTTVDSWVPWDRQPMWYRRDGGMFVMVEDPKLRIADQDWSELIIEAFPCTNKWCPVVKKAVYDRATSAKTEITMATDGKGHLEFNISKASDGGARAWKIRVNLLPKQRGFNAKVDGESVDVEHIGKIAWDDGSPMWGYFPFGEHRETAAQAGEVTLITLPSSAEARQATLSVGGALTGRAECAWTLGNCLDSWCCKESGSFCYSKNEFYAVCNTSCEKRVGQDGAPWTCDDHGWAPPPQKIDSTKDQYATGTSLFCFTVLHKSNKGTATELLDMQKKQKAGIFGCDASSTISVDSKNMSLVFVETWKKFAKEAKYADYDWTVKADADAVFLPGNLKEYLGSLKAPGWPGVYLKTSKDGCGVEESLTIFSKMGMMAFLENTKECSLYIKYWDWSFSLASCADAFDVGHMETFDLNKGADRCAEGHWVASFSHNTTSSWNSCYKKAGGDKTLSTETKSNKNTADKDKDDRKPKGDDAKDDKNGKQKNGKDEDGDEDEEEEGVESRTTVLTDVEEKFEAAQSTEVPVIAQRVGIFWRAAAGGASGAAMVLGAASMGRHWSSRSEHRAALVTPITDSGAD